MLACSPWAVSPDKYERPDAACERSVHFNVSYVLLCADGLVFGDLANVMAAKPYICLNPAQLQLCNVVELQFLSKKGWLRNNFLPENQASCALCPLPRLSAMSPASGRCNLSDAVLIPTRTFITHCSASCTVFYPFASELDAIMS